MSIIFEERAKIGYGLGKEEGEAFWLLGMLQTIKIGKADTGGQFGMMAAYRGGVFTQVPLASAVAALKTVPAELIDLASALLA